MRFQWLKDYQDNEEQLLYLKWNLNKSKLELDRWVNGDLQKIRLEKNSRSASLEENIKLLTKEIGLLNNQQNELKKLVSTFSGLDNEIVRLKYIDGNSLEKIAEETGYSSSYIRKRHSEIRGKLDFLDAYESRNSERCKKQNEIDYYNANEVERRRQLTLF